MGKVDDLRAMREARYLAMQRVKNPAPLTQSVRRRLSRTEDEGAGAAAVGGSQPDAVTLCGHQSISKKRCSREKDHPEKNHRYPKS